ncbi:MAG: spore coat protein CotJB [Lachnospiraceae bacterium]
MNQRLQNMDQRSLLHWIDMVSMCMYDMILYLDTHPKDTDAMQYFSQYKQMREDAMDVFGNKFYPLLLDRAKPDCYWKWVLSPWPWEGGC